MKILRNLDAWDGEMAMVTLTGPGADRLPDDRARWSWNASAPARWSSLHRRARQRVLRRHGTAPVLLAYVWEYQRRGVLHVHVLLGVSTAAQARAAHLYALALDRAPGFGWADGGRGNASWRQKGPKPISARHGARYVAKYVAPLDGDGKAAVSESVRRDDCPSRPIYVSGDLLSRTGVTMRWLRNVRLAYALGVDPGTPTNPRWWTLASAQEDPWRRFQTRLREAGRCPP